MIKLINSGLNEGNVGKLNVAIAFETNTVADQYKWTVTKPDGSELDVGTGQGKQTIFTLSDTIKNSAENNGDYLISVSP